MTLSVACLPYAKRFIYKHLFSILAACFVVYIAWSALGIDAFFYKRIFGTYTGENNSIWQTPKIEDVKDENKEQIYNINGYHIRKTLRKKFALSAVSVFKDDNTTFWKWYFHQSGNEGGRIYNKVASFDLSTVHGKMANKGNLKKIKFSHELNGLIWDCIENDCYYSGSEVNNFHIIPKNNAIRYGMKALPRKKHTPVYIEGYLMDWQSVEFPALKLETALHTGQISKQKAAGRTTGLCFQLYLTKLVYDGYVFE